MLIHKLAVAEEERNVSSARIKSLLQTYRKGSINEMEVKRYYAEWTEIATRIKKGTEMLDSATAVQDRSKQHMRELEDLYTLLMKLLGMYDTFFKTMFATKPEYYQRASRSILDILK